MNQSSMQCSSKVSSWKKILLLAAFLFLLTDHSPQLTAAVAVAEKERDPVTISVVVVNPSTTKTQTVPVKIDLPQEVTPKDVLEKGDLEVEYSDEHSSYYLYKKEVLLAPKETKVFRAVVKDLWFIPSEKLDSLRSYTELILGRLKKTGYFDSAKKLAGNITEQLNEIAAMQGDEGLSRKTRIGNYRRNLLALGQIKEDLARMEKLLTFTGGPPVPEMLEESPLKSDSPSRTTTWLVIFLIIVFLGLLGGQFFFTWHRRIKSAQNVASVREATFAILDDPEGGRSSTTQSAGTVKKPQEMPKQTNGHGTQPPPKTSSNV